MINKDPRKVPEPYLGVVKERATVDGVVQLLTQPGPFSRRRRCALWLC